MRAGGGGEVVLDPRPFAGLPGGLEAIAERRQRPGQHIGRAHRAFLQKGGRQRTAVIVRAIRRDRKEFTEHEYPDEAHASRVPAYRATAIGKGLFAQKRP
jgi:hypothetical protein